MRRGTEYVPTSADREIVERLAAAGHGKTEIAATVAIARDTLRKHFVEELLNGQARHRRDVINMLFESARRGKVSAIIRLEHLTRLAGARAARDA